MIYKDSTDTKTSKKSGIGLKGLLQALELMRMLDPEMPAQTILTLLLVAKNPGISLSELAALLGTTSASSSRNVAILSARSFYDKKEKRWLPGHGLVESVENEQDRRVKCVSLTPAGERVINSLREIFGEV